MEHLGRERQVQVRRHVVVSLDLVGDVLPFDFVCLYVGQLGLWGPEHFVDPLEVVLSLKIKNFSLFLGVLTFVKSLDVFVGLLFHFGDEQCSFFHLVGVFVVELLDNIQILRCQLVFHEKYLVNLVNLHQALCKRLSDFVILKTIA